MNQEIDIKTSTDLQLASFSIQAHIELQRAIQNVQMIQSEVARREQLVAAKAATKISDDAGK